jgi:hypothetical protein
MLHAIGGVAILLYFLLDLNRPLNLNDEGVAVYAAMRILDGDVPYKDFWMVGYTPGNFYVLAGLFKLFGPSIIVERVWDVLIRLTIVLVVYLFVRRLASPWAALITSVIVAIELIPPYFYYGYVAFPALLFCLVSVLFLSSYFTDRRIHWVVLSGFAVGLALLFRHDFGAYALAAGGLGILAFEATSVQPSVRIRITSSAKVLAIWMVPVLVVTTPVAIYFLWTVPFEVLWSELVVNPLHVFTKTRALPYPELLPGSIHSLTSWMSFYFPLIVYVLAIPIALTQRAIDPQTHIGAVYRWSLLLVGLLGAFLFLQALSRNDAIHLLPTYVTATILLVVLVYHRLKDARLRLRPVTYVALLACLTIVGFYYVGNPAAGQVLSSIRSLNSTCSSYFAQSGNICVRLDQRQAIEFVQAQTTKSERIFVGVTRHDRLFANDNMFYYLAERASATKHHVLVPGVATTMSVQQEIIDGIEKFNVRIVVRFAGHDWYEEPNASRVSSGVTLLDDYLTTHFKQVERFGDYTILQRNSN